MKANLARIAQTLLILESQFSNCGEKSMIFTRKPTKDGKGKHSEGSKLRGTQVAVIKHKVPVSPSISPKHTGLRQKQTSHASLPFSTLLLSPGICFVFVVAINSAPEASDY